MRTFVRCTHKKRNVFPFSITPDNFQSMRKQIKTQNMAIDACQCQTDFTAILKLVICWIEQLLVLNPKIGASFHSVTFPPRKVSTVNLSVKEFERSEFGGHCSEVSLSASDTTLLSSRASH